MQTLTEPDDLEQAIKLKRNFLRAASLVAGSHNTSPALTSFAGNEAAELKTEIAQLEATLAAARSASQPKGD